MTAVYREAIHGQRSDENSRQNPIPICNSKRTSREDIHNAMEAGASGYVLKDSTEDKLLPAIRAVAAGQRWIPEDVARRLAARRLFEELTQRELLILNKVVKGLANKQIGDVLNISENTVKWHLKNILAKLSVADRAEAVAVAIQRGIIHFQ